MEKVCVCVCGEGCVRVVMQGGCLRQIFDGAEKQHCNTPDSRMEWQEKNK